MWSSWCFKKRLRSCVVDRWKGRGSLKAAGIDFVSNEKKKACTGAEIETSVQSSV